MKNMASPLKTIQIALTLLAGFSVLFFFQNSAHADWEKIPSSEFTLPAPPSDTEALIEISVLLKLQDERTQDECKLGLRQAAPDFKRLFENSPLITKNEMAIFAPLMGRVSHFGERITGSFKSYYRRMRPYDFDARVQPCIPRPGGRKSYPSSHATVSTLDACVLGLILPAHRKEFFDFGETLSERRMKVGVHFPSDVRAGQDLAEQICKRLQAENDFMNEISKLRRAL